MSYWFINSIIQAITKYYEPISSDGLVGIIQYINRITYEIRNGEHGLCKDGFRHKGVLWKLNRMNKCHGTD